MNGLVTAKARVYARAREIDIIENRRVEFGRLTATRLGERDCTTIRQDGQAGRARRGSRETSDHERNRREQRCNGAACREDSSSKASDYFVFLHRESAG